MIRQLRKKPHLRFEKKTHPNAIDHRIAFFYGLHEKMAEKMAENGFCSSKNIDGTHSFPFVFFFKCKIKGRTILNETMIRNKTGNYFFSNAQITPDIFA